MISGTKVIFFCKLHSDWVLAGQATIQQSMGEGRMTATKKMETVIYSDLLQLFFLIPDTFVSSIYSYARSTKQAHTKIS